MVHSVSGWTRDVQVKLWDPLRTRVIPERLRGVFTTRRYTNPRLPLPLPLPPLKHVQAFDVVFVQLRSQVCWLMSCITGEREEMSSVTYCPHRRREWGRRRHGTTCCPARSLSPYSTVTRTVSQWHVRPPSCTQHFLSPYTLQINSSLRSCNTSGQWNDV